ncbi:hypothetical protein [Nocardioides sp. Iso805N]|uniref:hypothetical protein n=1 Tax=Nocardioides sp. Iso805N TaxID=1283287 RepID=UPI00036DDA9D|nr:hypothetical protein [Nocardioides sp. Iso805N]
MLGVVAPVPAGSAVLHIGPHKTGTSALQHALRLARTDLLQQGVRLAGRGSGDAEGARHALGLNLMHGVEAARAAWAAIRADLIDASVPRRVFSKETFANAGDGRARRVVSDLTADGTRLHVVVSARPVAELIPSQYSQFVQRGLCAMPFEEWAEAVLSGDTDDRTVRMFWKRHSHDEQVRRWGALVGQENLTVVVVDRRDPEFLARSFEQLLALRAGTLAARMGADRANRSLTVPELELVREWHTITARAGASRSDTVRLAWRLCHQLRQLDAAPDARRLALGEPARARADERAAASAAAIAASGARVLGNLAALASVPIAG